MDDQDLIPGRSQDFSLLHIPRLAMGAYSASDPVDTGVASLRVQCGTRS
jgi:hypothetical protein